MPSMRASPRSSPAAWSNRISFSLGGESLVLVYPVKEKKVTSIVGQGWEPKGASIEYFKSTRQDRLGADGLDPSVVPGSLHGALTVLEKWGTMSFEQVSARAIDYADNGFPLRPRTADTIARNLEFFKSWPDNQQLLAQARRLDVAAGRDDQAADARATRWKRMVEAERKARKKGRAAGIVAARDRFYKGDIADGDGGVPAKRTTRRTSSATSRSSSPAIEQPTSTDLQGIHGLQAGLRQPGAVAAADVEHPRELRSAGDGPRQPGLHPHAHRGDEAVYADRDTYYADQAFVKIARRRTAVEGLREGARRR